MRCGGLKTAWKADPEKLRRIKSGSLCKGNESEKAEARGRNGVAMSGWMTMQGGF
jgi:hypothetical protein